ncbi:MAG: UDP-4-amino-4,6-dideoxy-N-acetyl-beta-L-altrosamine transaminase [Syntrophales bacterium]|nr:UDP-4-amino-4,6-dideoxy-N-acetyl-beta-L-altrosamine transaminase [Syntrophales bacterium]
MVSRKKVRLFVDYIPYGRQCIDEDDIQVVVDVLRGDLITQGPVNEAFERAVAEYVGVTHAVVFSSGTAALHGAYFAAGVEPGDEIITSPLTFVATANAALYLGGRPVFADIDEKTLCLDPKEALRKVTDKTKAVVPVSYAGCPVDISAFREAMPGIPVIEDACHAIGGERNGNKVGKDADMTVFSFHPVKHITTGEGGMVVTDNEKFAERLRFFRSHGITKDPGLLLQKGQGPWYYEMQMLGYNYRLTDIQSALGLSQLRKLDASIAKRREIARRYDEGFAKVEWVTLPPQHPGHAYHLYPIQVNPTIRKKLFEHLRSNGIGVQVHYIPVHMHPYYREVLFFKKGDFPKAEMLYEGEISLPIFPQVTKDQQENILRTVLDI